VSLRSFLQPRAIAVIGASGDPQSISARPLRMLAQHGYAGDLFPVNPKYAELQGRRAYASIGAVPGPVDLALVAVPAPAVPSTLDECASAGVRHAVVLSSGFAESGPEGVRLQQAVAEVVTRSRMRVCGPNSEGFYSPTAGVCATFSPVVDPECGFEPAPPGPIAVVAQSGGVGFSLLARGRARGLAFGPVISTGNEVDLEWLDYVDHLLDAPSIRLVLGFVEGLRHPERLASVARKAARLRKPLVVAKIGRSEVAGRAAAAHTGRLVGSDRAYADAFDELGIVRVDDVDEMLDMACYVCVSRALPAGPRVAVLTVSGGAAAWLADCCATRGLELPEPEPEIQSEIRGFIPPYGSAGNPVDITAQAAFSGGFERALELLAHSGRFDAVVCVGSLLREESAARSLAELRQVTHTTHTPIAFYAYTGPSPAVRDGLADLGIPCFPTPDRAARALAAAVHYRAFLDRKGAPE
jgi:acetate---CoA ligase (ADP-forming)